MPCRAPETYKTKCLLCSNFTQLWWLWCVIKTNNYDKWLTEPKVVKKPLQIVTLCIHLTQSLLSNLISIILKRVNYIRLMIQNGLILKTQCLVWKVPTKKLESFHLQVHFPLYRHLRAKVAYSMWLLVCGVKNPGFTFQHGKTFFSLQ
jgi:hypothetical protein